MFETIVEPVVLAGKTDADGRREHPENNSLANQHLSPNDLTATMSAARKSTDSDFMVKEFVVTNKLGIHARPAAMFVKVANRFECDIFVEKDGEKVNGKSIMGILTLAASKGSTIYIKASGEDASEAITELETLIENKFGEK